MTAGDSAAFFAVTAESLAMPSFQATVTAMTGFCELLVLRLIGFTFSIPNYSLCFLLSSLSPMAEPLVYQRFWR